MPVRSAGRRRLLQQLVLAWAPRWTPARSSGLFGAAMLSLWTGGSHARAIDLNQASRAEIESVRGVGVELTERLLQARADGPFAHWQDLRRRVKGVGRRALSGFAESGFHIGGQPPPQN